MRLIDLEPKFLRHEQRESEVLVTVATLAEAQSIEFLCPYCFQKNGGNVGTHGVLVTFRDRGVADAHGSHNTAGAPSRWEVSGTGFADLTLNPSVNLQPGCEWHGWVKNGDAT